VVTAAIHRLIEEQAATHAESVALVEDGRSLTYRELNQRANLVARQLMAAGLRRGRRAVVVLPAGCDLVVVLLAVLKAGACYTWVDPDMAAGRFPPGVSVAAGSDQADERWTALDVSSLLRAPAHGSPNLPVLTRGFEVACVLEDSDGMPAVRVSHDTIATLRAATPASPQWAADPGVFEVWGALMAGSRVSMATPPVRVAAA